VLKERVVAFGPESSLIGIETLPVEDRVALGLPAVILLNAGVVHRIGPHRNMVKLARRLASAGFHVLRFDFSGRGDSRPRSHGTPAGAVIADGQAAMDLLAASAGHSRFVFGGLCSGADNSVRVALVDRRVVGTILLDPFGYRTPRFYLQRFQDRGGDLALLLRYLQRVLGARLRGWLARRSPQGVEASTSGRPPPAYRRKQPPKEVFGTQLRSLADRGVRMLAVYTGSASENYNYAEQFADAFRSFGLEGRVECELLRDVNHSFAELSSQELLCQLVVGWLESAFASGTAATSRSRADPVVESEPPVPSTLVAEASERGGEARDAAPAPKGRDERMVPATDVAPGAPDELAAAGLLEPATIRQPATKATLIERQIAIVRSQLELVGRLQQLRVRHTGRRDGKK
jgi:hypothetical protein